MKDVSSPASTGPAGGHFEGQVGASYLLSMLAGSEPRGLPGTIIDRVEFQRAAEGYPLDDVIVHAHDTSGNAATLEIQVKRSMTFTPSDQIFEKVVGQIAKAWDRAEFWNSRHELGIAISRSSQKIDGPYQDVLTWARQLGDAKTFIERIERSGSANTAMREFVNTFKTRLGAAGATNDNETVWSLLRRLHIFIFDFTATGSVSEELARERAVRVLHSEDGFRAGDLWKSLIELAIDIAKSGGDRTRDRLIADLKERSFRLAGDRHNLPERKALAEASRHALADITDRLSGVMLTRQEHISAVRKALDEGRYVEIRGNAGVGKSGVLKHFAQQISTQAAVVVLSPTRTVPKGWLSLRSVLGFEGTAHDFLSDLAASGSAVLFVDGLDFFGADERLTVIDLVREATTIAGMSVIVTARRDFGIAEPNWLPGEALDKLGQSKPVLMEELSDGEADELRSAAPHLAALLSESHPARQVARNLFRLSRLANRPSGAPALRTEAEMAEEWWQSADGARDAGHRDRARVLKTLAEQALACAEHLSVAGMPAPAVDALITSESLRDLGNDRVAFRHDVLREWAIANLLFFDPSLLEQLHLERPAPADLSRGLELAARLTLERTADAERWHSLYTAVSKIAANESWARATMLAVVRSEIAAEMLDKASVVLFADDGRMLRELIRIAIAVESEPAEKYYAALGFDPRNIPAAISVPVGPSWVRLILWLLKNGVAIPTPAIPDVVSLYFNWSLVWAGKDPFTPSIVAWFYYWLNQSRIGKVDDLTTGFLLFCNHTPHLAAEYLKSLNKNPYRRQAVRELLRFRGALAQAAPKELAELTADYLMPEDEEAEERESPFLDAFKYADLDFVPASPAQGPFYDLLVHAPEHGFPLIRRIIDHAITFKTGGRDYGKNAITVVFPDGSEKVFPWYQAYAWSRDLGAGPSVVASALMALEAWGHGRIEKGEAVDGVVADLIGESPAPATYLLVVVDLLLSHWPDSHAAAIPFVACPELLCLDRQRLLGDSVQIPDIFGLNATQREPAGPISIETLKTRASRRSSLDELLDRYVTEKYSSDRLVVTQLLKQAAHRLGPPQEQSDLGDPEFMVLHALNRLDPSNWRKATIQTSNGSHEMWQYVPPSAEGDHLKPLQDQAQERHANVGMQASIRIALNNVGRSSPGFAAVAVEWAQAVVNKPTQDETEQWMREEAIVTAAMIACRDGTAELVAAHHDWIRETFTRAFNSKHDPVHSIRDGLQYNPIAIAFAGTALLLKNRFEIADLRTLLEAAGSDNPAAAQGFASVVRLLAEIDERLPPAMLRCAFAACVRPWRQWGEPDTDYKARMDAHRRDVAAAVESELAWLEGKREEPIWPDFELAHPHSRHHYSSSERHRERYKKLRTPEQHTDHQAAALWLRKGADVFDVSQRQWLRDVANTYANWTAIANGSELDENDDPESIPHHWNDAYFNLLARCLPGQTITQINESSLGLVLQLPGEAFLDVMTTFVRNVDDVYFTGSDLGDAEAVHIRSELARHVMKSRQWEWQRRDLSDSISIHLGPAVAALVFNDFGHFQPPKSYLLPKGIDRLEPFLPLLKELAENGPFLFLATTLLNVLEVSPRPAHFELVCKAATSWLGAHPEDRAFWIEQAIGRRVCSVIEAILALQPTLFASEQRMRLEIDGILGKLVRLGVSEAYRLEEALREIP